MPVHASDLEQTEGQALWDALTRVGAHERRSLACRVV
jgi:hypothetical protein